MSNVFEKLIEACKDVQREVSDLVSNKENLFNDVNSLKGQKSALINEIGELLKARDNASLEVRAAKKSELEDIEIRKKEVAEIRARVDAERSIVITQEAELAAKLQELEKIKQDYETKLGDLTGRELLLSLKMAKLTEIGVTVS